jgi:hypothetical protein
MEVGKRTVWILAAFLLGLAVFFGQRASNSHSEAKQEARLVAICEKTVARDTFIANGFLRAADDIRERGGPDNIQRAQFYSASAYAIADSIPRPDGLKDTSQLIEANTITSPNGRVTYALTGHTKALQAAGCRQAVEQSP